MQSQNPQASAHVDAGVKPIVHKKMTATATVQMVIRGMKIPRCIDPNCLAPNPQALDNCPACGALAPMEREVREEAAIDIDHSILTRRARLFLALGRFFSNLGKP